MTRNTPLLSLATVCAVLLGSARIHAQTPLPPGLERPTKPPAAGTRTPGANLLGLPRADSSDPTSSVTTSSVSTPSASTHSVGGTNSYPDLLPVPVERLPVSIRTVGGTNSYALKIDGSKAEEVALYYAKEVGRILLIPPAAEIPDVKIKLIGDSLTREEYLFALEKILSMYGVVLEPEGDKFLKVFSKKTLRKEAIPILLHVPEKPHPEAGRVISQMISFNYIKATKAKEVFEFFRKDNGQLDIFDSKDGQVNSILVTDTQENVNRMLEIAKYIDKEPLPIEDEVFSWKIQYANAKDIADVLEKFSKASQSQTKEEITANTSGAPGMSRTTTTTSLPTQPNSFGSRPLPPGLIRPGVTPAPTSVAPNETRSATVSDADRGMIVGTPLIMVDDRSNKLIIKTHPANTNIFLQIIGQLDIPMAPDIEVKIIRLQHAIADSAGTKDGEKGIADILNELIGNASASKSSTGSKTSTSASAKRTSNYPTPGGNQNLTSTTSAPTPSPSISSLPGGKDGTGKVGELSKENITILADKRINGLIVMASPKDMITIEAIIKELDVELEQVIIETVLLQVKLNDTIRTGIDWIHSHVQNKSHIATMGAGGGGANKPLNDLATAAGIAAGYAGAKYYFLFDQLDLNMVVQASKEDTRTKVLQSPVLMTVNNKEAVLESTDMAYLYKGVRMSGGGYGGVYQEVPDYEQRDFGVTIKITPRISPNGNVTLTVDQKFETRGANQSFSSGSGSNDVTSASYPTISTTKLQADVSVKSGQTIMLGGLIKTLSVVNDNGIPILKDIPLIGRYLFGSTENSEESSELMVFLTPHVVRGSAEAQSDALRRLKNTNTDGVWSKGWSNSDLAEPPKFGEMLDREYRKLEQLKKEHEAEQRLKEFQERHKDNPVHTNLLYNKKYTLPPPHVEEKEVPLAEPEPSATKTSATLLSSGQMRVIEETTQPLLPAPPPIQPKTPEQPPEATN